MNREAKITLLKAAGAGLCCGLVLSTVLAVFTNLLVAYVNFLNVLAGSQVNETNIWVLLPLGSAFGLLLGTICGGVLVAMGKTGDGESEAKNKCFGCL